MNKEIFHTKQELTKMSLLPTRSGCAGRETEAFLWLGPQDAVSWPREGVTPRDRGEAQPQWAATCPFFREGNQAFEAKVSARKSPIGCCRSLHLQRPPRAIGKTHAVLAAPGAELCPDCVQSPLSLAWACLDRWHQCLVTTKDWGACSSRDISTLSPLGLQSPMRMLWAKQWCLGMVLKKPKISLRALVIKALRLTRVIMMELFPPLPPVTFIFLSGLPVSEQ